jgi:hypothetical protein
VSSLTLVVTGDVKPSAALAVPVSEPLGPAGSMSPVRLTTMMRKLARGDKRLARKH